MPLRKSLRWKAASASRRSAAAGFVTRPASPLIWASSLIAASVRSSRLNDLSAAMAGMDNSRTSAAAQAARTNASMGVPPFPSAGDSDRDYQGERQNMSRSWPKYLHALAARTVTQTGQPRLND